VYITSMRHAEESGQVEYDQDGHRYLLVNADFGGAECGDVSVLVAPSGAFQVVRAGSCETGSVLVGGDGRVVGGGAAGAGTVFASGPGDAFTLRTGKRGATLLTLQGQLLEAENTGGNARAFGLDEVADSPAHNPALGFHHMQARMLIDAEADNGGCRSFTLGMGTFAPGQGCHALHRHAHAEEVFFVWEGAGVHLTADGAEHPLSAGELAFIPRTEWHGFKNTGSTPVRAFFAYLGVGARADAGYEVMNFAAHSC
jgi:mannose-6-phosphate isomerase-like protein (cupin superfamily)